jgi:beta-lactam-binding protein with PASTA domain
VISQSPAAGSQVAAGSAVNLVVSSGPPTVSVPNVVAQTQATAQSQIIGAGLAVGSVTTQASSTAPINTVISQSPTGGSQVSAGSAVNLVVSSGPQTVAVSNFVGRTRQIAQFLITNAGLTVGAVTTQPSATAPINIVIGQSPAAGSQVAPGSAVSLVVSSGPPTVSVPNVVAQTQAAAQSQITGAGLTVGAVTTQPSATAPVNTVLSQSPTGGSQVAAGSAVTLVVSSGPSPAGGAPTVDKTVSSDGSGTRTTPAFSTATSGEVLLAFAAADGPSSGSQTLAVSGAGLVWTLVKRVNAQHGSAEIWRATAPGVLTNATVTSTPAVAGYGQSLTVVSFRGASGVGASVTANAATGAPSVSLTTTKANALVYGVANDWDRAVARSVPTTQVMVHQWVDSVAGDTFWVQAWSGSVASAGTTVRLNDTAPTTDRWNFAAVEVVP